MRNYSKKNLKNLSFLKESQREFIETNHKRQIISYKNKNNLFKIWTKNFNPDDKVIKSYKQFDNLVHNVLSCGNFTEYEGSTGDNSIKLVRANFCHKDKLCPTCAVGRAYKQQNKFLKSLEVNPELLSKNWYYIVTPIYHTIEDSLEEVIARVFELKKRINQQMRNFKRGKSNGFWSQFNGGMTSIEITHSINGWNVHINWLVNSDSKLKNLIHITDDRDKSWCQSPELSSFLNKFDNRSYIHSINELDFSSKEEIKTNLVEILKYSLKFSSLTSEQQIEVYYKTYRKQLFSTFGNLRGLNLDNVESEIVTDEIDYNNFFRLIYARVNDDYKLMYVDYKGTDVIDDSNTKRVNLSELMQVDKQIKLKKIQLKYDNLDEFVIFSKLKELRAKSMNDKRAGSPP